MFCDLFYQEIKFNRRHTLRKTGLVRTVLREDGSIHRTNSKYCGKSPKIRFHFRFHSFHATVSNYMTPGKAEIVMLDRIKSHLPKVLNLLKDIIT